MPRSSSAPRRSTVAGGGRSPARPGRRTCRTTFGSVCRCANRFTITSPVRPAARDEHLADAVTVEVDGVHGGPDRPVDATHAPHPRWIDVRDLAGHRSV